MPESKEELRKLTQEVQALGERFGKLEGQVGAVLQKHDALADRAKHLEDFRDKAQPNIWLLDGAKLILTAIGATILAGIGAGIWTATTMAFSLGQLSSDVKHQSEDMAGLKKNIDDLRNDLKQIPRVHDGKVVKATGNTVTIQDDDGVVYTLPVGPEVSIWIDGKRGTIADLQKGILASVTEMDGKAMKIDAKSPHP